MEDEKHACSRCSRTDLSLTANGKIRSHAANGKRASATNPHCPGGSDWPKHDCLTNQVFEKGTGWVCRVCGEIDTRPTAKQVQDAEYVIAHPDAPDEVFDEAEHILDLAQAGGVQPERRVEDMPSENQSAARALRDGAGIYPNPHRAPLPGGVHDMKGPRGPSEAEGSGGLDAQDPSSADAFMGSDQPEGGNTPTYFPSRYDGSCDTCGRDFDAGDNIRSDGSGGWEAEDCCGGSIDEDVQQRPQVTAPQLPVRQGRYRGPDPETGKASAWTRTTNFAEAIADSILLNDWQLRMAVLGLVKRPDLYERVRSLVQAHNGVALPDVAKIQRQVLNGITEDARLAAGSKDRARKGTILHKHTQEIDMGRKGLGDVPEEFRPDVQAYLMAMSASGLECVPDLIERSTSLPGYEVAGTFDRVLHVTRDLEPVTLDEGRVVQLHAGEYVIGDVKSGTDLSYAWLEILIQLSIYAHGVDESGVAVPQAGVNGNPPTWRWAKLPEFGIDRLRTDVGIVMHAPYGEGRAQLKYADLITGWRGAKICRQAIQYNKIKPSEAAISEYHVVPKPKEFTPAGGQAAHTKWATAGTKRAEAAAVVQAAPVPEPEDVVTTAATAVRPRRTWEDVARAVTTKDEANLVWSRMNKRRAEIGMTRINEVVAIMRKTLQELGVV